MGILKEIDIETRPCRYGLTSFFRNDTIVSRSLREYGEWAQAEIDFLLALVGSRDTVLDIGAFIGTHTLAFAKRVHGGGEVYAFEPQPVFFEVLKKNVDQNGMANVKLFNVAVSEEVSRLEISEADVRQTGNFAGTSLLDAVHSATDDSRQYVIDVMTVDQLAIDRCDLIKIDAENMEINILRGAQQTLRATRPVVFAECHSLRYGWPLAEFMKGERYRVYLLNVPAYNNDNFRRNVDNFLFDGHEAALIFIPEERLSGILDQLDQLQRLPSLIPSTTPDDLALGLLKKPQYKYEVMSKCDAAGVLGIEFWANETEVEQFRSELKTLQATAERMREEMGVLEELKIRALSLTSERDRLAEEKAELQATAERMREEMGVLEELKIRALSLTSERNRLAEEKAELQATIRSQHEALAQREEEVKRSATERRKLADDLAQIQAAHGNLDREVTALRATLQQQQEAIISKDATLSHIYNSHGWKTLSAYYEVRNKLLPEGTWQRAFAQRLFHSGLSLKRRFSQQGQLAAVAPLPQKEHEAAVTGEIVQSTGQVVQELMTRSARGEESSGEDYETLSGQIATLRQARLERLVLKRPQMVCVDETKLSTHAKSLVFMANDPVQVSIVIPVYNNLKFTLECLTSLMEHSSGIAYEVIVVDDGSSDQTPEILSLVPNITYIRNEENLGFIHTCNRGAEIARGQYIIFLNNDAQVTENWLQPLIQTFGDYDNVGAVGPKILFPDGRLQEAGALINPDAASKLIGLFDDPDLPRYNYAREVMYCSGACLLVNARKFRELGGFDVRLAPAYCEDWDLAFRLREQGLRVIYNPNSVLIHHLSVTANRINESFKMSCVVRNQQKLSQKWQVKIDRLNKVKVIALYLPQFHPIAENDLWWGKGFTEWTHVSKARPNFVGHYQPHFPADLGFYDLRVEETMDQQAELAKRYGIYGFCYFYYWFAGKRLLDLPLESLLKTNRPNIPFCLCWANENWTRKWDGRDDEVLIAQQHSDEDDREVMLDLIRYMRHPNYVRINGKPLLIIYRIKLFPDIRRTTEIWRELCRKEGLGEIYLAMVECFELAMAFEHPSNYGFDASMEFPPHGVDAPLEPNGKILNSDYTGVIHDYRQAILKYLQLEVPGYVRFRSVMPSWDNTPRRQNDPVMFENTCPEVYQAWLEAILDQTHEQNFGDERIVFINAWNEWGEGNHLEPDQKYGHRFLEATRNAQDRWLLKRENSLD